MTATSATVESALSNVGGDHSEVGNRCTLFRQNENECSAVRRVDAVPSSSEVASNSQVESPKGTVVLAAKNSEHRQNVDENTTTTKRISNSEQSEIIDLISDNEDAVNAEHVCCRMLPVIERQKKENHNANTSGNLNRKWKMSDAVNTSKRYKCNFCAFSAGFQSQLTMHIRIHTRERPYECEFCQKRFTQKANLKAHRKMHGSLFSFQCLNCRQGFPREQQWKAHESVCKEKQFECFLCNKEFYHQKGNLLAHVRRKHTGGKI